MRVHCEPIRACEVPRYQLGRDYTRVLPNVYLHRSVELDAMARARAAWCWSGGAGVLAGWSAAAALGVKWIDPALPAAINLPGHHRQPPGLELFRDVLAPDDVRLCQSFDVTSSARTASDLARRLPLDDAVRAIDAIYQATGLTPRELDAYVRGQSGLRGIRRAREAIALSDAGAESPWETTTRLVLVRAGLPIPETQIVIHGPDGRVIARADLGWREWRVLVEYDGDHHFDRHQRNRDIERWNALESAGWRVIRVKARQLASGRALLIDQVREVLRSYGAPL